VLVPVRYHGFIFSNHSNAKWMAWNVGLVWTPHSTEYQITTAR
jgi:hypothetical protein